MAKTRKCPIHRCRARITSGLIMCWPHWYITPESLQQQINTAFNNDDANDLTRALDEAILHITQLDKTPALDICRTCGRHATAQVGPNAYTDPPTTLARLHAATAALEAIQDLPTHTIQGRPYLLLDDVNVVISGEDENGQA
jgi:hypothetical protein